MNIFIKLFLLSIPLFVTLIFVSKYEYYFEYYNYSIKLEANPNNKDKCIFENIKEANPNSWIFFYSEWEIINKCENARPASEIIQY